MLAKWIDFLFFFKSQNLVSAEICTFAKICWNLPEWTEHSKIDRNLIRSGTWGIMVPVYILVWNILAIMGRINNNTARINNNENKWRKMTTLLFFFFSLLSNCVVSSNTKLLHIFYFLLLHLLLCFLGRRRCSFRASFIFFLHIYFFFFLSFFLSLLFSSLLWVLLYFFMGLFVFVSAGFVWAYGEEGERRPDFCSWVVCLCGGWVVWVGFLRVGIGGLGLSVVVGGGVALLACRAEQMQLLRTLQNTSPTTQTAILGLLKVLALALGLRVKPQNLTLMLVVEASFATSRGSGFKTSLGT